MRPTSPNTIGILPMKQTNQNNQGVGASSGSTRFAPEARAGLRPTGNDPARIRAEFVADKIGKAQRRVILSLTDDWGKAACHQTARRMFYGVTAQRHTVIHHKHCTDNCWRLSDLGQSVKAVLIEREKST
jgi:hypothetical protein